MKQKTCEDCGNTFDYHRGSPPKRCVPCREIKRKEAAAALKARYHNDPAWREHVKAQALGHYYEHRETTLERVSEYNKANRDKRAKLMLSWQRRNKAKVAAANKAWKAANPEAVAAMAHNRMMRIREAEGSWTAEEWRQVLARFGGVCPCCGSAEDLTIDHIVPIAWGGNNFHWNLQPLCPSSNYGKADRAIADFLPWDGTGPRLAFYEYLGPAPRITRAEPSGTHPAPQPQHACAQP